MSEWCYFHKSREDERVLGRKEVGSSGNCGAKCFISWVKAIEDVGDKYFVWERIVDCCKIISNHPKFIEVFWNGLVTAREISGLEPNLKLLNLRVRVEKGFKSKSEAPKGTNRDDMAYDKFGERREDDA